MSNDTRPVTKRSEEGAPISVSAPGTLMIAGEHAVLHGKHALVAAVDRRVTLTLKARADDQISIRSELGTREMTLSTIDASRPFHFLGAVLHKHKSRLTSGFDLTIGSDFPADVGLGSSSAVTVAAMAAITTWITGQFPDHEVLMQDAVSIIREVQGMGSGADVAAAVWGGMLLYKATPEIVSRYDILPPIALVYAGYKTPTPDVIRIVEHRRQQSDDAFRSLFDRIDTAVLFANAAMKAANWNLLGTVMNAGQQLMAELGVCDDALAEIVGHMQTMPPIHGAKISGSGLGDCVLGIGALDTINWGYEEIPVALSPIGVQQERLAGT